MRCSCQEACRQLCESVEHGGKKVWEGGMGGDGVSLVVRVLACDGRVHCRINGEFLSGVAMRFPISYGIKLP